MVLYLKQVKDMTNLPEFNPDEDLEALDLQTDELPPLGLSVDELIEALQKVSARGGGKKEAVFFRSRTLRSECNFFPIRGMDDEDYPHCCFLEALSAQDLEDLRERKPIDPRISLDPHMREFLAEGAEI